MAGEGEAPRRHWSARHTVVCVVVVLVVVAGTVFAVQRHTAQVRAERAAEVAAATQARDEAVTSLEGSVSDYREALTSATSAVELVTPDEDQTVGEAVYEVVDQALVAALVEMVEASDGMIAAATGGEATGEFATIGAHDEQVAAIESATATVTGLNDRITAATADLTAATAAVTASHDAWLIEQARAEFDAAAADLAAQIVTAQAMLDESAGKVADDAVRAALSESIEAAKTAIEVAAGETAEVLDKQSAAMGAAAADLDTKARAMSDAQAAWQAEQDRLAAEAAAAASGGSKSSGSKSSGGTKPSDSSSGSSSSGSGGSTGGGAVPPITEHYDNTPPVSTPGEAIAGVTAARSAAGLQTVSSCDEVPGTFQAGVGTVHAAPTWDAWLTSTDHRAIVMAPKPAVLSAWNAVSGTGTYAIYMKVSVCVTPS